MSKRKRRSNYIIHYTITTILIVGILVALSLTVFFKADKLDIIGAPDDETVGAITVGANYAVGRNLFRINFDNVRLAVLNACPTLSDVKVSRSLPNKIKIECAASAPEYAIYTENEIFLLSDTGRIIATGEGILVQNLYGIDITGKNIGDFVLSKEQLAIIEKINAEFFENDMLVDINLSSPSSVKVIYQDRITINLDNLSELSYYVKSTAEIIQNKLDNGAKGQLFHVNGAFHFDPQ
jgi:hypothetical protein